MADLTDNDIVDRYGRENPAVFGGVWFDGDRLQVGVTDHRGVHESRLRALLAEPDRVDVVAARWTVTHLEHVLAQVEQSTAPHPGMLQTWGLGRQVVPVGLRADGEAVAAELHARFGDAVEVTVGEHPYPPSARWAPVPDAPAATEPADGVDLTLRLDSDKVRSGATVQGTLVVHNATATPVLLRGGATQIATVLDSAGAVAGVVAGPMAAVGMSRPVEADRIVYLPVLVGTAGVGQYATPPGCYSVVVPLTVSELDGRHRRRLLSPPATLLVLP